jgi:hypothetical protein
MVISGRSARKRPAAIISLFLLEVNRQIHQKLRWNFSHLNKDRVQSFSEIKSKATMWKTLKIAQGIEELSAAKKAHT